jgi:hypothetical protein
LWVERHKATAPELGEKWLGNIFGVLCGGRRTTGENFSGGINIKSPDELNDLLETDSHNVVPNAPNDRRKPVQ